MIRLNFFGDFVASNTYPLSEVNVDKSLNDLLETGDVNIINFEAPCPKENYSGILYKSGPVLKQPAAAPNWLAKHGFHVASLANNHMMDYCDKGFEDTLAAFPSQLKTIGGGDWQTAYGLKYFNTGGGKIAFLALTHCEFGTFTDKSNTKMRNGCAWICHPDVNKVILQAKKQAAYLFIFAHAGVENIEYPLPEWRELYRHFIDMGCDGVIASHPHIRQGWEIYNNKPIAYSLGNFFFPSRTIKSGSWCDSLCASVNIDDEGNVTLEMIPLTFSDTSIGIDTRSTSISHLNQLNSVLADEELYLMTINKICLDLLPTYYRLFSLGGLYKSIPWILLCKNIVKRIIGRKIYTGDPIHLLNNLHCESHRWCIARALRIKHSI